MFDNLSPQQQAMLMMAAGLLSPQPRNMGKGAQFAGALSQGIQGGLLGFNQASQEKRRAELMAQEAAIRKAQLGEIEREGQFRNALAQGFQPGGMNDDPTSMTYGQASPAGFDFGEAMKIDPMKALQMQASMKPKPMVVPKGAAVLGPDNKPLYTNEEKPKPDKPKYQAGDIRTFDSGRVRYTEEFDGQGWKLKAKSAVDKPEGDKMPAAPQGYQWGADGKSLTPIPGGPADAKVGKEAEALRKREEGALARADMVLGNVREAINESGITTAGPLGAIGRNIPGTGAYNLNKKLDAIRSNIGFAELQAMREASPTGGALGQVAVQELNMLQSVLGSLDTAQSPAQLEKTLYAIEKHYTNWKEAVKKSRGDASGVDELVKKYGGK